VEKDCWKVVQKERQCGKTTSMISLFSVSAREKVKPLWMFGDEDRSTILQGRPRKQHSKIGHRKESRKLALEFPSSDRLGEVSRRGRQNSQELKGFSDGYEQRIPTERGPEFQTDGSKEEKKKESRYLSEIDG